jgi:hypothetical protein
MKKHKQKLDKKKMSNINNESSIESENPYNDESDNDDDDDDEEEGDPNSSMASPTRRMM